jgi:hypothetical protein
MPKLVLREGCLPVIPADDLILPARDTTVIGTITMLSPSSQALDLVEVRNDSFPQGAAAYRRARLDLDLSVAPYYGGIIQARVALVERGISGYMLSAELKEWKEYPVNTPLVKESVERMLRQRRAQFQRLITELGFDEWRSDGILQLQGYDPEADICIYSMAGEAVMDGITEKRPMLIVWATPAGEIKHVVLTSAGSLLERR